MHPSEDFGQNQHPAALVALEPCHHRLDLGIVLNGRGPNLHREGWGCVLDGAQHQTGLRRRRGIKEDRHTYDRRHDLCQHLQPFAGHRRVEIAEAGYIPTRVS